MNKLSLYLLIFAMVLSASRTLPFVVHNNTELTFKVFLKEGERVFPLITRLGDEFMKFGEHAFEISDRFYGRGSNVNIKFVCTYPEKGRSIEHAAYLTFQSSPYDIGLEKDSHIILRMEQAPVLFVMITPDSNGDFCYVENKHSVKNQQRKAEEQKRQAEIREKQEREAELQRQQREQQMKEQEKAGKGGVQLEKLENLLKEVMPIARKNLVGADLGVLRNEALPILIKYYPDGFNHEMNTRSIARKVRALFHPDRAGTDQQLRMLYTELFKALNGIFEPKTVGKVEMDPAGAPN
jgi:hypothetical protein